MKSKISITAGSVFGLWTILNKDEKSLPGSPKYLCRCSCGTTRSVLGSSLRRGVSKSCGCAKKLSTQQQFLKHGMIDSRTYYSWKSMKQRCNNPKNKQYHDYGGRGITYDPRWESFENFYNDMGEKPGGMSLDRVDVDGNYCKENCRWTTWSVQMHNKRKQSKNNSTPTSRFIGVYFSKVTNDWEACLVKGGVTVLRERFKTEIQAAIAYDQASFSEYGNAPNEKLIKEYNKNG